MNAFLAPIREKRAEYEARPQLVREVIGEGNLKARAVARETLREVTEAMKIDYGFLSFG